MSRQRAESLLKQGDKEGCFVVRKSSTKGLYTLSLHTKVLVLSQIAYSSIFGSGKMVQYLFIFFVYLQPSVACQTLSY